MLLTVRQLISRLRKMPQGAHVAYQAHDQTPDEEIDAYIGSVQLASEPLCKQENEPNLVLLRW
jgi:methylthioribose-1-phosphate isomerase